jgi:DNA recombination protein RmuC
MQAILKDVKMREQAHLIQREVVHLMEDTGRLRERVLDLQRHFGQANADIEKIVTSSERIHSRGRKIEALEFDEQAPAPVEVERRNGAPLPLSSTERSPGVAQAGQPSPHRGEGESRSRQASAGRNGGPRIVRQPDLLAKEP